VSGPEPLFDALILAGGLARRLGGADKPMVEIGGRTLLDRAVESCAEAGRITVVGPPRPTGRPVRWTREDPPGGGPAAAIAAGLPDCSREWVVVLAADLPFVDADTVHSLWTAVAESGDAADSPVDGAVTVDSGGREQWLAAIYRRRALHAELAERAAGGVTGLPLRRLVENLALARVAGLAGAVLDCDTWEDVAAARRIAGQDRS
jgi:molybdopterin-guanine dinucleotide biosynthesis protein A